jgi:Cu/Ag efflux protein CusF
MLNIENKTRAAAPRHFVPLGFVFLVLAFSFGSLVSNAAQQENAGKTPCRITRINAKTGVVSASVIEGSPAGGVQSFQFFVKDSAMRDSLKEGQEILADFNAQEVFTSAGASGQGVRLGGILTDYYGKNLGGPAGGSGTGGAGQSQAGTQSGPTQPGGGMGGGNMGGGIAGAGQSQAGSPCGPPPQSGSVGNPLAGQNLGNAANPGQPNCQITNIDAATGLVRAKNLSTGQEFQFRVKDSAQLHSLHVGEDFFANLDSRQVSFDGKAFSGMQGFSFFNAGAQD